MQRQYPGNEPTSSGWVTTRVAAAALGVKPRQVRNLIAEGELEAKTEGEGVSRRYLISIPSLESLRAERHAEGKVPGQDRVGAESAVTPEQDVALLLREITAELGETRYRLGRAEARLELTAEAESTLREALERERERADKAERRADDLEARLTSFQAPSDGPVTSLEDARGVEDQEPAAAPQKGVQRRSWWRRFFGF